MECSGSASAALSVKLFDERAQVCQACARVCVGMCRCAIQARGDDSRAYDSGRTHRVLLGAAPRPVSACDHPDWPPAVSQYCGQERVTASASVSVCVCVCVCARFVWEQNSHKCARTTTRSGDGSEANAPAQRLWPPTFTQARTQLGRGTRTFSSPWIAQHTRAPTRVHSPAALS